MDMYKENYVSQVSNSNINPQQMFDELIGGKTYKTRRYIHKFAKKEIVKHDARYIKFTQNQLQILDDLMNSGGDKKYIDSHNKLRFSEHSGLMDFDKTQLERIIVSGKTNREDSDDTEILLPQNMEDALDYEYIFHTHPPTPYPGARVSQGVLYEFPSISDLYHFAYHYNEGNVQGSFIMAPEGAYIIRMKSNVKYIDFPSAKKEEKMADIQFKIQDKAIAKYGKDFAHHRQDIFFKEVAQDTTYIEYFNKLVREYFHPEMQVLYKPREFDKKTGKWIIKNLSLKVNPVEITYK